MTLETIAALAVAGVLAALGWLARWAWGHTHKRIDDAWSAIDQKAPNEELTRVRNTQTAIFEKFDKHDKDDRDRHTQIVMGLGRVEGKVEALLNRKREGSRG